MPPTRTNTKPFTPVKTERSHQENQERAYVAASRRSDRSLEARIESARRASEIHKQRTGRSLRITEAAVLNEEMYEEDDDDLPAHMRRLTAHLRLNQQDADLDRRLGSLLVSQIGMRQALPITQHSSFYRYAPNGLPSGFTPSQGMHPSLARPSPLNTNWNQNNTNAHSRQNSMSHGGISPTQVTKSRISPYPTPQSPFTQAQSPASLQPHSPYQHSSSLSSAPSLSHRQDSVTSTHFPQTQTQGELETPFDLFQDTSPFVYGSPLHQDPAQTLFPFTSALPLESQQILAGSGFDYNDQSFGSMFQASDDYLQHIAPTTDEKEQQDAANEEQFGAFWNDVILGA